MFLKQFSIPLEKFSRITDTKSEFQFIKDNSNTLNLKTKDIVQKGLLFFEFLCTRLGFRTKSLYIHSGNRTVSNQVSKNEYCLLDEIELW